MKLIALALLLAGIGASPKPKCPPPGCPGPCPGCRVQAQPFNF